MMKPFTSVTAHAPHSSVYPSCNVKRSVIALDREISFPFFSLHKMRMGSEKVEVWCHVQGHPTLEGKMYITGHCAGIIPIIIPPPLKKTQTFNLI